MTQQDEMRGRAVGSYSQPFSCCCYYLTIPTLADQVTAVGPCQSVTKGVPIGCEDESCMDKIAGSTSVACLREASCGIL
ncbi:MAG: hypothetical protein ACYSYV_09045 [Planctomycetota bacterium]